MQLLYKLQVCEHIRDYIRVGTKKIKYTKFKTRRKFEIKNRRNLMLRGEQATLIFFTQHD
jgi:hypothetical protein